MVYFSVSEALAVSCRDKEVIGGIGVVGMWQNAADFPFGRFRGSFVLGSGSPHLSRQRQLESRAKSRYICYVHMYGDVSKKAASAYHMEEA